MSKSNIWRIWKL